MRSQVGIPSEVNVRLKYAVYYTTTAAATFKNLRFNPNAAYDVDPTLGSTSTPFFAEWAALYKFYRVIGYSYKIQIVNKETFPVTIIIMNTNTDPGTGATLLGLAGNPRVTTYVLPGSAGPCTHVFRGSHRVADIVGSRAVENDDNFCALTNARPANVIWLTIGADTTSASNLTNGMVQSVEITMLVRFYEPALFAV